MRCSKHNVKKAAELFEHGIDLYENRKYNDAISIFSHLIKYHTDAIEEWNICEYLGVCHFNIENYTKAIQYLEKGYIIISNIENEEHSKLIFLHFLGSAFTNKSEYMNAINYFKEADQYLGFYYNEKHYNDLCLFHKDRGYCNMRAGYYDDALCEFEKAIKVATENLSDVDKGNRLNELYYMIGGTYYSMSDFEKAYDYMIQVKPRTLVKPYDDYFRRIFFELLVYKEYFDQALLEYKKLNISKLRDVDKSSIYFWLAKALYHKGLYSESRNALDNAIKYPIDRDWIKKQYNELHEMLNSIN